MSKINLALQVDAAQFPGLLERLAGAGIDVETSAQVIPTLEGCRSHNVITSRTADHAIAWINDHIDAYCPDWRQITMSFADMTPAEQAAFLDFATHDCMWTDEDAPEVDELHAQDYERFRAAWPRLFAPQASAYPPGGTYLLTIEPENVENVREMLSQAGVRFNPRHDQELKNIYFTTAPVRARNAPVTETMRAMPNLFIRLRMLRISVRSSAMP